MSATMKRESPPKQPITVEEYHRMAQVGMFDNNSRVELIEGEIIDMAPIGISHCSVVDRLNQWLVKALTDEAIVRVGGSFRLSNITEPQPDVILLEPRDDFYASKVATGEDTLLVIEVSDTTLRYDRNVKVPLYARHGIPEVWIVDIDSGRLHCFRRLIDQGYKEVTVTDRPGVVTLPGVPTVTVDLSRLLDI